MSRSASVLLPLLSCRSYVSASSSAWSMSRLWNSMKKGLGAASPATSAMPKLSVASNPTSSQEIQQSKTTSARSKSQQSIDYVWKPTLKTYSEEEIRKVPSDFDPIPAIISSSLK